MSIEQKYDIFILLSVTLLLGSCTQEANNAHSIHIQDIEIKTSNTIVKSYDTIVCFDPKIHRVSLRKILTCICYVKTTQIFKIQDRCSA